MSFMTVRLAAPGVKLLQTATLLPANIVKSQNIRWRGGLPEKIGGWTQYYAFQIQGITREIWPWADLNGVNHVAVAGTGGVTAITGNLQTVLTPLFNDWTPSPAAFTFTAGSSDVTVDIVSFNPTIYESVTLQAPISGGGIVVYPGNYDIVEVASPDEFIISIAPLVATESGAGVQTAQFATTEGSANVTVTLPNHGLGPGANFSIVVPTVVDGFTLSGFSEVLPIPAPDTDTFTIAGQSLASSTNTEWYGNLDGNIALRQWVTVTQLPSAGGWGIGPWGGFVPSTDGLTAWGQSPAPPPITGTALQAADWDLENWGSQLIIHPIDGTLFFWDPTSGIQSAQQIVPSPTLAHGFFIAMPQQQIVAYGASVAGVQDPMLVAWCDNGNYNAWTASAANQAGTYRLTRGSKIIGGIQGPLQALLWTDVGMWIMQYIGYPDVWGFYEIARGCGLIAKKAVCVVGQAVYWMSRDGFWIFAGSGAQRLPCDVWDVIFKNLTSNQEWWGNIRAAANTGFDEFALYFPSQASVTGENDTEVKFNVVTGEWDYTLLPSNQMISEWIDTNIFGHPFSTMTNDAGNSLIMQHEMSMNANQEAISWSITTGYFQLSEAQDFVFVDYCIPDFKWKRWQQPQSTSAIIQLTFFVQDYPDDDLQPPVAIGPFFVTNRTDALDIRCRGRYFSIQIAGNDLNSFMRLGGLKFRFAPDGRN